MPRVDAILRARPSIRHLVYVAIALFTTWTLYSLLLAEGPYGFPAFRDDDAPIRLTPEYGSKVPETWPEKAQAVKGAFVHAYHGWERWAAPADELLPLSEESQDNFNGWGVTMFDSLDTMLLMGLKDDFNRALIRVGQATWSLKPNQQAPFFETVIRYLGGLLSAYALSHEPILLQKADELGRLLSPAFESPSGFPVYSVSTVTGRAKGSQVGSLAEIASCQLEYLYLAKETGRKEHFDRANKVIQNLAKANVTATGGMLPTHWNVTSGQPIEDILSVGAAADSAHEYLLKQALLTGKTDKTSVEMYLRMTTVVIADLLYVSPTRQLLYVTDVVGTNRTPSHTFEHLSTFAAGLFALGAHTLPLDDLASLGINFTALGENLPPSARATHALLSRLPLRAVHEWIADGLATTSWLTYADSRSGLGPEEIQFHRVAAVLPSGPTAPAPGPAPAMRWADVLAEWEKKGKRGVPPGVGDRDEVVYTDAEQYTPPHSRTRSRDYAVKKPEYLLRPETIESFYLMWKTTGDIKWRERGWAVFEAIERYTKTRAGYASVRATDFVPPPKADDMPSFFLAETLKYLYLLFSDEDPIPLDKWVLNTEAHPFPVFEWTAEERTHFGIA